MTMKMKTKMNVKLAVIIGLATLAVTPVFAKGTKDSLQFSYREAMTNDGVEPDAVGTVAANESEQGSSSKQKFDVSVSGLTPDTDYDLTADVNGTGTVDLGTFTTDSKGKAALHLTSSASGHSGKNNTPLPDGVELSQIIEIDVLNGSSQAVLTADTTAPGSLKYMIKRNLNNGGTAEGSLQIKTSNGKTKFTLNASGLDADTDYQLVFNGTPVETVTSDSKGKLKLTEAPLPDNILDVQTEEIWDASNTAVLGTATPLP